MICISSLHYKGQNETKIVRSHKLTPHETVTLFCILEGEKENIVSILEDHLLETISRVEWNIHDIETDFSYVAEHFNHFIKNIHPNDLVGVSIVFASNTKDTLIFSTIGDAQVVLTENDGETTLLSSEPDDHKEFHSISSGEIPSKGVIYISSSPLYTILGEDLLVEFSALDENTWIHTSKNILTREYSEDIHIFRIENTHIDIRHLDRKKNLAVLPIQWLGELFREIRSKLQVPSWKYFMFDHTENNKKIQLGILIIGIILLFILLYTFIKSVSSSLYTASTDSKNQLLEAQNLIEQSQKLMNNPGAFNANIKKAEQILFILRDKKEHLADTQDLLSQIEAMKKEVNDIQIVDIGKYSSIIKFNASDISPLGVFEKNKKLTMIGKNGAIVDYARNTPLPKVTPYPPEESAIQYDVEENGNFFILTGNNRILSPRGNALTYVTVSGQDTWEAAQGIKTFNGNLYLINKERNQIFKHKPGLNGFSSQTSILPEGTVTNIMDIGIDGAIYILTQEGKILQYINGKSDIPKSLIINKIPGEYTVGKDSLLRLFVGPNLGYFYILSGNNIWIFQPDAKRFQDITSLTYIAQLELQTSEEVRNMYIPHDGIINIVTNLGVYEIRFEIADNKLILR